MGFFLPLQKMLFISLYTKEHWQGKGDTGFSPFCIKCNSGIIDSPVHKYCLCIYVSDAWFLLRELIENLDISMTFETEHTLLHLYYEEPINGHSVLWLLGEYVGLVEQLAVRESRIIRRSTLLNYLRQKWLESKQKAIHNINFIPGLFPSGIG